jgi:opacity protein-like surface antigen
MKPSSAPGKSDFSRKGVYLSVGFLSSAGEFDFDRVDETLDLPIVPNIDETTSVEGDGMSLRVGFRTSENFAFEILLDFASYDMTEDTPGIEFDGSIDTVMLGFNGKIYIPIERFEPYALFGVGFGTIDVSSDYNDGVNFVSGSTSFSAFDLKFGFGMDIYAHRNFAVFLEWAFNMGFGFDGGSRSYFGVTNDLTFGAMFRF